MIDRLKSNPTFRSLALLVICCCPILVGVGLGRIRYVLLGIVIASALLCFFDVQIVNWLFGKIESESTLDQNQAGQPNQPEVKNDQSL